MKVYTESSEEGTITAKTENMLKKNVKKHVHESDETRINWWREEKSTEKDITVIQSRSRHVLNKLLIMLWVSKASRGDL